MPESLLLATDEDLLDTYHVLVAARLGVLGVETNPASRPDIEARFQDGLIEPDGLRWRLTVAGRAWLNGWETGRGMCVVCGKPSPDAECNACVREEDRKHVRLEDR